ncbi:hypothetical protein [Mycolicibacterium austroafricanum]|uniref:hypothetical protein n=1 Tax=Mycolicibacterium austroafricanum TaxID=39687 RepID=UPI0011AE3398|nr:hypothetical protein [Mycolicibacterium austroafricanum]
MAIGAFVGGTIVNLCSKLVANSVMSTAPGANRLIMARRDIAEFTVTCGSPHINNETSIPLSGGHVGFGSPVGQSKLRSYAGKMYDARIYDKPLSAENLSYVYNKWAARFGLSLLHDAGIDPGGPVLCLDPGNPDPQMFVMPGGAGPARCERLGANLLRIHGEGSAGVELPYETTQLRIRYKLSGIPVRGERYVIATFGSVAQPLRLHIDAANPRNLYANDVLVAAVDKPTSFNNLIITLSNNKVAVGSLNFNFPAMPRCYLGSAFPENSLPASRSIDYDVSAMKAVQPRNPDP